MYVWTSHKHKRCPPPFNKKLYHQHDFEADILGKNVQLQNVALPSLS